MELPLEYRWLKAHGFEGLTPWYLIDPQDSEEIRKEYQIETGKDIIPFARRQDNDDVAGFECVGSETTSAVITCHLTWASRLEVNGFPSIGESKDLFTWLSNVVIPATKEWMNEEELKEIESNQKELEENDAQTE